MLLGNGSNVSSERKVYEGHHWIISHEKWGKKNKDSASPSYYIIL
jgi:hypothetical protein